MAEKSPRSGDMSEAAQERRPYLLVFAALSILTLIEVGVTYTPLPRMLILLPLAIIKAGLVVLFYMHLRYDKAIFGALFVMGIVMGLILIISLALMFGPPLIGVSQ